MAGENIELFSQQTGSAVPRSSASAPLADKLRPAKWEDFKGLARLDHNLVAQLKKGKGRPPSLILWGSPGTGKTTLAKLIGKSFDCHFVSFSAVLGGVKDIREIIAQARKSPQLTILFIDEIHRFNKAQQDALLPHVESGVIVLIGATTENPSFSVNAALLSRSRVVQLPDHNTETLEEILERGLGELRLELGAEAKQYLVKAVGGDARSLLNLLEDVDRVFREREGAPSEEEVKKYLERAVAHFYDRTGEEHYNVASAFIKSLRGSDPDAALYWGFRMVESGEDPRFIFRRLIIFASEDVGNADPRALTLAVSASDAYERVGLPEGRIPLAQCITYLATAPKSNRSYMAMNEVLAEIRENPKSNVPIHLRNAPTKLMKEIGYGKEYRYPHDYENAYLPDEQYLPDDLVGKKFYRPALRGYERKIQEWLNALRGVLKRDSNDTSK
ncbi:MAG: replication-associated recombination protein A [Bdellovibrionales bacterium]|nr:replication-associated recombination protein A [Bdellovibrionales bacterium]